MATIAHRLLGTLLGAAVGALFVACGGAPTDAASPDSAESSQSAQASEPAEPEPSPEELRADRTRALQATCEDGTCFSCGDGVCPVGAYCATAPDGAQACAWVPECPKPSCACVTRALGSGCSCSESGGAPQVTCQ